MLRSISPAFRRLRSTRATPFSKAATLCPDSAAQSASSSVCRNRRQPYRHVGTNHLQPLARHAAPGVAGIMRIGPVNVAHPVALAPMEEHTSLPFRMLCKQFGASLVCGERLDAVDVAARD